MIQPLQLKCPDCGRTVAVTVEEQLKIAGGMTRPAQRHAVVCPCGMIEWSLEKGSKA